MTKTVALLASINLGKVLRRSEWRCQKFTKKGSLSRFIA